MADASQVAVTEALKLMIAAASSADVTAMLIEILDSFYRGDPASVSLAHRRLRALAETGYDLGFRGSIPGDTAVIGHGIVSYDPRSPYFIHRSLMLAAARALGLSTPGYDQNQLSDMDAFWRASPRAPLSNEAQALLPELDASGLPGVMRATAEMNLRPDPLEPRPGPVGHWPLAGEAWEGLPVTGTLTTVWADAPPREGNNNYPHFALDIATDAGTPVRSVADGEVIAVVSIYWASAIPPEDGGGTVTVIEGESDPIWSRGHAEDGTARLAAYTGNFIAIRHDDGTVAVYEHLIAPPADENTQGLHRGDRVPKGTQIGQVGNTGYSFGNHLHFELSAAPFGNLDPRYAYFRFNR